MIQLFVQQEAKTWKQEEEGNASDDGTSFSIANKTRSESCRRLGLIALNFTCQVIDLCQTVGCQYVAENPLSGGLWNFPRLSTLLRKDFIGVFDMCRFGTSYRKPTKLCGSCPWIERFNLRCNCSLCHEHLCGLTRCSVPVVFSRNFAVLNGFGVIEFMEIKLKLIYVCQHSNLLEPTY